MIPVRQKSLPNRYLRGQNPRVKLKISTTHRTFEQPFAFISTQIESDLSVRDKHSQPSASCLQDLDFHPFARPVNIVQKNAAPDDRPRRIRLLRSPSFPTKRPVFVGTPSCQSAHDTPLFAKTTLFSIAETLHTFHPKSNEAKLFNLKRS